MLHSKFSYIVISLLLTSLISSCNKNYIISPNENTPQKQMSKIIQDDNNYSTFSYLNNRLSNYETINDSKLFRSIILSYAGNNKLKTENFSDKFNSYLRKFNYDSTGKMIRANYLYTNSSGNNPSINIYINYVYNNLGQLYRTEQYNYNDSTKEFVNTFNIDYKYDASGNVVERSIYTADGNLFEKEISTYDDKINPWYSLKDCFYYDATLSKNNLKSVTITYSNTPSLNMQTDYTYTYDASGYPLTCQIVAAQGGNNSTINEKFEYQ
jgi:hypothetical protein